MTRPRQIRTPQQRAEDTLGVARRAAEKAVKRLAAAEEAVAAAKVEHEQTRARLEYAVGNPDLTGPSRDDARAFLADTAPQVDED